MITKPLGREDRTMARLSTFLLLALLTAGCAAKRGGSGRRNNRGGRKSPRCPITGCQRCNNQTSCQVCRPGFALTEEEKCGSCGSHCSTCTRAGPGHCDVCTRGYTLHTETRQLPGLPTEDTHGTCEKCAQHCNACDTAGPNKCDTCGPRRMLDVRMELHDEVHECVTCGSGCRKCSADVGCKTCRPLPEPLEPGPSGPAALPHPSAPAHAYIPPLNSPTAHRPLLT